MEREMVMNRKELVVSTGDPLGIGPEISLKAAHAWLSANRTASVCLVIGEQTLHAHCQASERAALEAAGVRFLTVAAPALKSSGGPTRESGEEALAVLEAALRRVRSAPNSCALVTAPVSKEAMDRPARPFRGHTGWLADAFGVPEAVMLFAAPTFRVALATVHIPLRSVSDALTIVGLTQTLTILTEGLRTRYRIPSPSLAILGLNPHAGEGGLLGKEEQEVLLPAMASLEASLAAKFQGPFSADTFFSHGRHERFDAVVAMYHDQGLIPVKTLAFGRSVNVTLGLPIVRTSVDHGCAFDLFGRGVADHSSLLVAMEHAAMLLDAG
jgi:4-hydroxythreonine-4-phosphate dehydrogenase